MSSGSKKIREERMTAFEGMKAIMEKIDRGERLSVEERADFDARNRRISELEADLRTAEAAEKLAETMRADKARVAEVRQVIDPEKRAQETFTNFLRTADPREYRDFMGQGLSPASAGTAGPNFPPTPTTGNSFGYLVPPGFWQRLQIRLKAYGGVLNDFQLLETETGQPIQWAGVDPTAVIGTIVGEGGTAPTQNYSATVSQLSAWMFSSGVQLVSVQLAQDSAFDIEGFVADRVGESLGRALASYALSGTGSSQPQGLFTALATQGTTTTNTPNGTGGLLRIGTANSINIGGTTSTEVASNTLGEQSLRNMIAQVDPAYRGQGAKFYMNDAQLLGVRALTDGNGRPLVNMQDGVTPGVPTSIWGYEVVVDPTIPALGGTVNSIAGLGGPAFGHLGSAMVYRRVTGDVSIQALDQVYAAQYQIGYIGHLRADTRANDLRAACTVLAA